MVVYPPVLNGLSRIRCSLGNWRVVSLGTGTINVQPGLSAAVKVSATGGELTPEFSLVARGVEALELHPDKYHFEPGDDATIAWTAGTDPAARIQVLLMTGWHGSPNLTTIWCETKDDGELMIPAALTEDFPIPSCGECEGSFISRFTRDTVDFGNGPIELFVASRHWFVAWWGW